LSMRPWSITSGLLSYSDQMCIARAFSFISKE